MNEMQLIINTMPTGEISWNYEEIKAGIAAIAAEYEGAVYTEETLKQAKADRAELNKLATAIDDKRKEVKNILLAPYNRFEAEVKDVLALLKKPAAEIDTQVKDYEEQQKRKKLQDIRTLYDHGNFHGVPLETLFDQKWLNATTKMSAIEKELATAERAIAADMAILEMQGEYRFEALQTYNQTRDLSEALQTIQRLKEQARAKAEFEARRQAVEAAKEGRRIEAEEMEAAYNAAQNGTEAQEPAPAITYGEDGLPDIDAIGDTRKTIVLRVTLTDDEEAALLDFLQARKIEFFHYEV